MGGKRNCCYVGVVNPLSLPWPHDLLPPKPDDSVRSLERGLRMISAFNGEKSLDLTQLIERLGTTRSTTRRIAMTLVNLGYLERNGREYRPTAKVLWLAYSHRQNVSLADVCRPYVNALVRHLQTIASVAVLDGRHVEYVCRAGSQPVFIAALAEGGRLPADKTSLGRVLLSRATQREVEGTLILSGYDGGPKEQSLRKEIAQVRAQGWAFTDQILEAGLQAAAVPIRNQEGRVVAALSATSTAGMEPLKDRLGDVVQALNESADRIRQELPAWVPSPREASRSNIF
uniref:IclR family transcriptional regulator domain-containing protein n=1 Tax=Arthrobacter sp. TaxID=1667 RepID=UPI0020D23307|nr:IclR family transcriptional regulator C-terminal domain-containing protein [Arthrobacter sp.]